MFFFFSQKSCLNFYFFLRKVLLIALCLISYYLLISMQRGAKILHLNIDWWFQFGLITLYEILEKMCPPCCKKTPVELQGISILAVFVGSHLTFSEIILFKILSHIKYGISFTKNLNINSSCREKLFFFFLLDLIFVDHRRI